MSTPTHSESGKASPQLVSRSELAARYGVCLRTVDAWRIRSIIPHVRMPGGRLIRFPLQACDAVVMGTLVPAQG